MDINCKECEIVRQVRQRRISYNQLTEAEKKQYWENYKKLLKPIPANDMEPLNPLVS